ncbi:16S rRNA (cytosine(1402)-N(4))-methyltransferase [Thiohalocapsa halophila]|uniref:Ribosomal RNA small subunit methyltransferase H n=1 Tax=Thiohalocapsa halophila TaxID=69359 RepID=A0ABS1CMI8_9GAMM|nr:16S rRNA (cytosine(1402)-N(4))-methyltransferase RsmH [Thiohalocapsa halophila]MBK1632561.1 16S rRNA (cytosine(1402)-N(4))-methyltransferase [Thiohalocapsa halophila]
MDSREHIPVLLGESMQALGVRADGVYVDATFGRGGHARAILERLGSGGRLLAVDRDPDAVAAGAALAAAEPRLTLRRARFGELSRLVHSAGLSGRVNGLLADLGVSSPQLDSPERGFAFSAEGPLDMRMDPSAGTSAADWLAAAAERDIARVLKDYGEERFAKRIARAVCAARGESPITTTGQLAALCERAVPTREPGKHPATRTFQALRLQVNAELDELRALLAGACDWLAAGGRLVVISFHSLEDRIVKRFIRDESRGASLPKGLPITDDQVPRRLRPIGGAVRPGDDEVRANPRARSAVLRAAERLA